MSLSLTEQLERTLAFLTHARNPFVMTVLGTRGFEQRDLDEGWDLFSTAAGAKLRYTSMSGDPLAPDERAKLIADLDAWENRWFPVVNATLKRRYPQLHREVFKNLSQTEGAEVLVSVSTLLERLATVGAKEGDGQAADALLVKRGLTPEVRAEASESIATLKTAAAAPLPQIDSASKEEQEAARAEAWAWYLEWSEIARTVIKRGDILIRLGLRQAKRGSKDDDTL